MIVLTAVLLSLCSIQPATADSLSPGETILVNTVEDEYDLIGSGTGCSLREAIQSANDDSAFGGCSAGLGTDTVTFLSGVHTFKLSIYQVMGEDDNSVGDLDISSDVIIQGNGKGVTTIDASYTLPGHPFGIMTITDDLDAGLRSVTIRDLTLTGGTARGAIENHETLLLEDVTILNNQSGTSGGGLYSSPDENTQSTTIRRCSFIGNHADSAQGGGIAVYNTVTIEGSYFIGNYSGNNKGGGAYLVLYNPPHTATITGTVFNGNTAASDGGNLYLSAGQYTTTVITSSTFTDGETTAGRGGGAFIATSYSPTTTIHIIGATFQDNEAELDGGNLYIQANASGGSALVEVSIFTGGMTAAGDGGNIYAAEDDEEEPLHLTIRRSEISEGTAGYDTNAELGGGIFTASDLTLENVTISSNSAHTGGGIYTAGESSGSTFKNVTLVYNTHDGTYGAGIYKGNTGVINFQNSIVALNNQYSSCSGHTCDCYTGGADISTGNNLENGDSCGFNYSNTDPLLSPLGMHGGISRTHALLSGSQAIDAGNNATCLADDQRGWYRPLDGDENGTATCDIGAYEYSHLLRFLPLIRK